MRRWTDEEINRFARRGLGVLVLVALVVSAAGWLSDDDPVEEPSVHAEALIGAEFDARPRSEFDLPETTNAPTTTVSLLAADVLERPPFSLGSSSTTTIEAPETSPSTTTSAPSPATTSTIAAVTTTGVTTTTLSATTTTVPPTTTTTVASTTTTTLLQSPEIFLEEFTGDVEGAQIEWYVEVEIQLGVTTGSPVGALVDLSWTGATDGEGTHEVTDPDGLRFTLGPFDGGSVTVTVTSVLLDGFVYEPGSNETPATITLFAPSEDD